MYVSQEIVLAMVRLISFLRVMYIAIGLTLLPSPLDKAMSLAPKKKGSDTFRDKAFLHDNKLSQYSRVPSALVFRTIPPPSSISCFLLLLLLQETNSLEEDVFV